MDGPRVDFCLPSLAFPGFPEALEIMLGTISGDSEPVVGNDNGLHTAERISREIDRNPRRVRVQGIPNELGNGLDRVACAGDLLKMVMLCLERNRRHRSPFD
ncbi:hypothetical protein D3C80_1905030 [compost metagenome]